MWAFVQPCLGMVCMWNLVVCGGACVMGSDGDVVLVGLGEWFVGVNGLGGGKGMVSGY